MRRELRIMCIMCIYGQMFNVHMCSVCMLEMYSTAYGLHLHLFVMTFVLQDGCNPLFIATCKGHPDIVKLLIEAGANICQANNVGVSSFFLLTVICIYIRQCVKKQN